jgi:hypothetical protein
MTAIAIVHPMTLVGKELRERLDSAALLAAEVRLYSDDEEEIGTVTEAGGGAAFVDRLTEGVLGEASLAFFCGTIEQDRPHLGALGEGTRAIVLSSGAGMRDGCPAATGLNEGRWIGEPRLLNPAPGALLLARLAEALRPAGARSFSATILHPVSELGQKGLDALFEETRGLLTFSAGNKARLFGAQIAFNLLPGRLPGDEVARQATALLGDGGPALSVQTAQAGVFHGVAASVCVELEGPTTAAEVRRLLSRSPEIALSKHSERLGPVEAAGEERILVGEVSEAGSGAVWIWAAMDNLTTGGAINALRVAASLTGSGPIV